mgnify:CR=1 FL=1
MYLGHILDITYWNESCLSRFLAKCLENGKPEAQRQLSLRTSYDSTVLLTNFPFIFFYEIWQGSDPYMVVYSYQIWCHFESILLPN